MKKAYSFFTILFAAIIISGITLRAQTDTVPCRMDCEGYPWIAAHLGPYPVNPALCPGCTIEFDYWYRPAACEQFHDLQLGQITISLECLQCPLTKKDFVQFAIDKMIRDNPLPKPGLDTCQTNWRAFASSCWGNLVFGNDTVIEPCPPAQCCWQLLEVCGIGDGAINYRIIDSYSPDQQRCYYYPWPCEFTCEGAPENPPTIPTGIEERENTETGYKSAVFPNPSTGWVNIRLNSELMGDHSFEVYDASGRLVLSDNFNKKNKEMFIQFDMNGKANGNYNYTIKRNGQAVFNGNFNVAK